MVKKSLILSIILIMVLVLSSCVTDPTLMNSYSKIYSVTGVGTTEARAKRDAISKIDEYFKNNVNIDSSYVGFESNFSFYENLEYISNGKVKQEKDGTYSYEITLDKKAMTNAMKANLDIFEEEIEKSLKSAKSERSVFGELKYLLNAREIAYKEYELQAYLYTIDGKNRKTEIDSINSKIEKAIKGEKVGINIKGNDENGFLEKKISEFFLNQGFGLDKKGKIQIHVNFSYKLQQDPEQNFFIANYEMNVEVIEKNTTTLTYTNTGKGTGVTEEKAVQKAEEQATNYFFDNIGIK